MKINYNLDINDLIEFQKFNYYDNKKSNIVSIISIIVLFTFLLSMNFNKGIDFLILKGSIYTIIIILYLIFIYFINDKIILYIYGRTIKKGNFESALGDTRFEINENNIFIYGDKNESKISLDKIIKIKENDKYFYIYFTTYSAIIIPKFKVSGEKEELFRFIQDIKIKKTRT